MVVEYKSTFSARLKIAQSIASLANSQGGAHGTRTIYDWSQANDPSVQWRPGNVYGSFSPMVDCSSGMTSKVRVKIDGNVAIDLAELATRPPFEDEDRRLVLLQRLNEVPGIALSPADISRSAIVAAGGDQ